MFSLSFSLCLFLLLSRRRAAAVAVFVDALLRERRNHVQCQDEVDRRHGDGPGEDQALRVVGCGGGREAEKRRDPEEG